MRKKRDRNLWIKWKNLATKCVKSGTPKNGIRRRRRESADGDDLSL